jgi:DNA/RNA-binding domain of Phe-tRNA-synthetase-like protein
LAGLTYSISKQIFEKYPGYCRCVVLAFDVRNGRSPERLIQRLREAEASIRKQTTIERIAEHPRVKSWRDAYKAFGAKPSEYRSSVEAMARRALRNEPLPSINALVDIGNMISLQHLVPVGGHSMDDLTQDIALRFATGEETFCPFGSNESESPLPGEVIFAEGNIVLTRRWTWRQANHTLTLPETPSIEVNIDRLPPVELEELHAIANQVMGLVEEFCGGKSRYEILSARNPQMKLEKTSDSTLSEASQSNKLIIESVHHTAGSGSTRFATRYHNVSNIGLPLLTTGGSSQVVGKPVIDAA